MQKPQLHYYDIDDNVVAFSSTRHGGYSTGSHGEFNINEHCGDDATAIARNRQILCEELGVADANVIVPHQTHGVEVRQIAADFLALPLPVRKMILDGVDAVMTNLENVCVGVSTADCIPILLSDSRHGAVCAVHAGWRGTLSRVVMRAVAEMRLAYDTNPADLKAVIGPGISFDAFEVGDEVYEQFVTANFDMQGISRQMKMNGSEEYKWHIDLVECNRQQLQLCGLAAGNIQSFDICTYSNTDDYFSARKLGIDSGRIYSAVMRK